MPVAPATIVRTKRSCPGTSTTLSARPGRQRELREAELDRDAALALLGQPVGVHAGERLDQRGLAVVDVPGGAERERRVAASRSARARRARRARRTRPRPRRSCAGRAAGALAHACHDRRVAARAAARAARRRRAPAAHRDRRALQLEQRQRAAADRARWRARSRTPAAAARPPRSRRAAARRAPRAPARGAASICSTGISRSRALRVAVQAQRRLERRQRELVDPHAPARADARAAARSPPPCPRPCPPAARPAACRRRSRRRRRPRATLVARRRLVARARSPSSSSRRGEHAGAEVVDQRQPARRASARAPRSRPPP